jgi:hypothetical protein
MSDEPPDYIDWHGRNASGPSFLGCIGMGVGLIFMATGGLCVVTGVQSGGVQLLVGLVLIGVGFLMYRKG